MARITTGRLALVAALLLTACSGGEAQEADDVATASPTPQASAISTEIPSASPEPSATAVGDAEFTVDWAVPFTITGPADWGLGEATTATAVEVVDGTGLRVVLSAFLKSPDAPDVWIERLTTHKAIDASEPRPVEIGGAAGHVFDARLNDSAPACAGGGSSLGGACLTIHGPEDGFLWVIEEGRAMRIWVLDAEGETVMLSSDAREDRFDAWVPMIDQVVSTLEWEQQ